MSTVRALDRRAAPLPEATARPDWFLRDSKGADARWSFAATSVPEEDRPVHISWDFSLPSGGRFTDPAHAPLLESARCLLARIRWGSLSTGRPQRASTARIHFIRLRALVRWMDREGFHRFADLDSGAVLRYQRTTAARSGKTGAPVASTTIDVSNRLLRYLYRYREEVGDGLMVDPFHGHSGHATVRVPQGTTGSIPYTPEAVAVPLVQGAIAFLAESAIDILCARERYAAAYDRALRQGLRRQARRRAGLAAVRSRTIRLPAALEASDSPADLGELIDRLYIACFVVISYLVGPRVSEVLSLRSGCVKALSTVDGVVHTGLAVIAGTIFKLEVDYHGCQHEWVAPPPAVHAVFVLEALSAPHRQRSGRTELWLRPLARRLGATEWGLDAPPSVRIPPTERINQGIRRLGAWLSLPPYDGRTWTLSTHQGRNYVASQTT